MEPTSNNAFVVLEILYTVRARNTDKLQEESGLDVEQLNAAVSFLERRQAIIVVRGSEHNLPGIMLRSAAVAILPVGEALYHEMKEQHSEASMPGFGEPDAGRKAEVMGKMIFVSHTESDAKIAESLVEYLLTATRIGDENLFCSSVPGHQLNFGQTIAQQLKDNVRTSAVLVALLSVDCLKRSSWVLFELGAAWGSDKLIIPILGPGLAIDDLPGPLKEARAIRIQDDKAAQSLTRAIINVCDVLSLQINPSEKVQIKQQKFIEIFRNSVPSRFRPP